MDRMWALVFWASALHSSSEHHLVTFAFCLKNFLAIIYGAGLIAINLFSFRLFEEKY